MNSIRSVRTLHVIHTDPANYPPTISACRIWAARGNEVHLLGFYRGLHCYFSAGSDIREYYVNDLPGSWPKSPVAKINSLMRFRRLVKSLVARHRPHVVFAYDFPSAWATLSLSGKAPVVGHFHDLPGGGQTPLGKLDSTMNRWVLRNMHRLRAVIMPEARRLEITQGSWGFQCPSFVVPNCSVLSKYERTDILKSVLEQRTQAPIGQIVVRIGGAGPENMIEESVEALRFLSTTYHLCLIGCGDEHYGLKLRNIAQSIDRASNLHLFSYLNYDDMRAYVRSASIGLALYAPNSKDINKQHQATASDKYMEYIAAGVPVIACPYSGFLELGARTGGVVLTEKEDAVGIADAIQRATSIPETHRTLCQESYAAHRSEFNYEHQYAPVFGFIESLVD